jgi:hypothetical protein
VRLQVLIVDIVGGPHQGADRLQRLRQQVARNRREHRGAQFIVGQRRIQQDLAGRCQNGRGEVQILQGAQPRLLVCLQRLAEQVLQHLIQDIQCVVVRSGLQAMHERYQGG